MLKNRVLAEWLLLFVTLLACATGCQDAKTPSNDADSESSLLNGKLTAEETAPFTHVELPDITGNKMHELHFAKGTECGECHFSTEPLPINHAHEICHDCHQDVVVQKPVWENHCLSCHHFTVEAETAKGNAVRLAKHLCQQCHDGEGVGGYLYGACATTTTEEMLCDNCHQPHNLNAPPIGEHCAQCHPDHRDVRHLATSSADCSLCHRAHRPAPTGQEVCTTCHGQAENVLVHRIPDHPKDCLACHEPHFTTIELTHVCLDCHESLSYISNTNQPEKHLDCQNCHRLSDFRFNGSRACAACHQSQGATLNNEGTLDKHQRCTNCHREHSWYTSYEQNCTRCHEASEEIFEHRAEFHPKECRACHDAHAVSSTPASGDCLGCHADWSALPPFGTSSPEMHLTCANCHDAGELETGNFEFVGAASSCQICHAQPTDNLAWDEVPDGHTYCTNCHTAHVFKPAAPAESCAICHSDAAGKATNEMHADCQNCHLGDHGFTFAGMESSCLFCHADVADVAPNELHSDCANCHSMDHQFAFSGAESTCQLCHTDVVAAAPNVLHASCESCHVADHSVEFAGAATSCAVCHTNLLAEHNSIGHTECTYCHNSHAFTAHYDTCTICHTDRDDHYRGFPCGQCHKFAEGGVYKEHKEN